MELFTSAELASIVADYDQRNGTTIDTELELMSALATAGIRCSGGRNGLQEYLLEAYRAQQQQVREADTRRSCHHHDDGQHAAMHSHSGGRSHGTVVGAAASGGGGLSTSRGGGGHLPLGSITSPGRSVVTPRRSGMGGSIISGNAVLEAVPTVPGDVSPQQRRRIGSRVSPVASDGSPSTSADHVRLVHNAPPALRRSLFHAPPTAGRGGRASVASTHHPHGGGSVSLLGGSLALERAPTTAAAERQLSSRRIAAGGSYDASVEGGHHVRGHHHHHHYHHQDEAGGHKGRDEAGSPTCTPIPSWLRLELPMDSATYVQLLLALKTSLFRQVISDASHGGEGGAAAHSSNAPVVVERSIAALLDRATNPLASQGGDLLHLGDETLSGGDDDDDERGEANVGATRPSSTNANSNRALSSSPKSPTSTATGSIPAAMLHKLQGLPSNMQQQRVASVQTELSAYRQALLDVLQQGEQWGTFFQQVGGVHARGGGGGTTNEDFASSSFRGGSFSSFSFAASTRSVQEEASPRSAAASPLNAARRGTKPGGNVAAVVRNVLNGVNLDPSLLLQAYDDHCASLTKATADVFCRPSMEKAAESPGDRSISPTLNSPGAVLSPTTLDPAFAGAGERTPAPAAAAAAEDIRDDAPGAAAFANWLMARQDLVVRQLGLFAEGKPITTDGHSNGRGTTNPSAADGGGTAARRWKQSPPHGGGAASLDVFAVNHGVDASGGGDALGHLSPILDEAMLQQRRGSDVDITAARMFDGRTPRRGDEQLSGLSPVSRVVERLRIKLSHLRSVVPMELTFPYAASVVAKDYKRVTSVDEMLRDMCSSLPSSKVHGVACALRDRRHARLSPLAHGDDRAWPHQHQQKEKGKHRQQDPAALRRENPLVVDDGSPFQRQQLPCTAAVTPPAGAPLSTAETCLFGATGQGSNDVHESQGYDTPPPQPLDAVGGCGGGERREGALAQDENSHPSPSAPPTAAATAADATSVTLSADATRAADGAAATAQQQQAIDDTTSGVAVAAPSTHDVPAVDPTVGEDEALMAFWLQGGVPRPAPSPAKYAKQRRAVTAAHR